MLQRLFQWGHVAASFPLRLCNSRKGNALAVILQILIEQHGVIPFLLRLHFIPVFKAVQPDGRIIIGKIQIKIGGVELPVDLLIEQFRYFYIHDVSLSTLRSFFSCSLQTGQMYRILRS